MNVYDIRALVVDPRHLDQRSLRLCRLVSKDFNRIALPHTFSSVTVTHANAEAFDNLLRAPRCTFRNQLTGLTADLVAGLQHWFGRLSKTLSQAGVTIKALTLTGAGATPLRKEAQDAIVLYYPLLDSLTIRRLTFDTFADLAKLFNNFQNLHHFECSATSSKLPAARDALTGPLSSPGFKTLVLGSPWAVRSILGLVKSRLPLTLSRLTIHMDSDFQALTSFSDYLQVSDNDLLSLTVSIRFDHTTMCTPDAFKTMFKLGELRTLQELHLLTDPPLEPQFIIEILFPLHGAAERLQTLSISMQVTPAAAQLDSLWAGGTMCPNLRRITILGSAPKHQVEQFLPLCKAKQILLFWDA